MAGALDAYVKNVFHFTSAGQTRELVELNRKAVGEVLDKNVGHLNRVFDALNVEDHSLSIVAVLLAKMNHFWNSSNVEKLERVLSQVEVSLPLLNKEQIMLAPDLFIALFHRVYQTFSRKNAQPVRGIELLSAAITFLIDGPGEFTSLHSCLFCLCLRADIYDPALPFLRAPVTKIFKETQSGPYMDSRYVLLYFYYGALIFGALGHYEDCLAMLESVLSVPAIAVSAIVVHAYKKYILVSLVVHGKVVALPNYRAVVIPRVVKRLCAEYLAVEKIFTQGSRTDDKAGLLLSHLEENIAVFRKDGNVGLVKRVVRKIREKSVINLTKCFVSLSLSEVARRCHLSGPEHAEEYLVDMSAQNLISARIDREHRIVHFFETEVAVSDEELEEAMGHCFRLSDLLKEFDIRMRCNAVYVNRCSKSALGVHDDEGFQQGASFASAASAAPLIEMLLPS